MPDEKTRSERFHELMTGLSGEWLDADIDAKLKDPNFQPRAVELRDDPDPFGLDWTWAEPQTGEEAQR